jgi:hypothetical protein
MLKESNESIEEFEARVSRLEREYREVRRENTKIKDYIYALTVAFVIVVVAIFFVLRFTGNAIVEFNTGSFTDAVGEGNFSHVIISSTDPYYGLIPSSCTGTLTCGGQGSQGGDACANIDGCSWDVGVTTCTGDLTCEGQTSASACGWFDGQAWGSCTWTDIGYGLACYSGSLPGSCNTWDSNQALCEAESGHSGQCTFNPNYVCSGTPTNDACSQWASDGASCQLYTGHAGQCTWSAEQNAGLLAYYSFDGDNMGESLSANDYTSNDKDGIYNGNANVNVTDCEYGRCVTFDGTGDYINVGNNLGLSDSNVHSKMAWVKISASASGTQTIMDFGGNSGQIQLNVDGASYHVYCAASDGDPFEGDTLISKNTWTHVACVSDGSNMCAYINGALDGCAAIAPSGSFGSFIIGGSQSRFNGNIDELMVFGSALSEPQVSSIYAATSPRFNVTSGTHNFTGINFGSNTTTNITLGEYVTPPGTNISVQINSGSIVNFTNGVITNYNIAGSLTSATLNLIYITDSNKFFSPIAGGNVTLDSWDPNLYGGVNVTLDSSLVSGEQYSFVDFDNSLVGWWRGEGNANDEKGIFNGTYNGNANASSPGVYNSSFGFDGSGDFITFEGTFGGGFTDPRKFTIAAWMYDLNSSTARTAWFGWNTLPRLGAQQGKIDFDPALNGVDGAGTAVTSVGSIQVGVWTHVTFTYNGEEVVVYLDGVRSANTTFVGAYMPTSGGTFRIGGTPYAAQSFKGRVDELLIFNRSLTSGEVLSLYNSTVNQYQNNFTAVNGTSYGLTAYTVNESAVKLSNTTTAIAPAVTSLTLGGVDSDTIDPSITVTSPTNTTYVTSNVTIDFTSSDANGISGRWFYNGTANVTYSNSTNITLASGNYSFIFYSNDTSNNVNSTSVSFHMANGEGEVNITINSTAVISFLTSSINWGSGSVDFGANNATLDTSLGTVVGGNWNGVDSGFMIENMGNSNVTLSLSAGKSAAQFIGGTNPVYQYNITSNETTSCVAGAVGLGGWYDVNITSPGTVVCNPLRFEDSADTVRVDLRLVVPSDSYTGALGDTITATAAAA